jgi:anti-sigma regulatory factor (Ser/Thr protein kinase)
MPPTFRQTLARNVQSYIPVAEEVERFCAEHELPKSVLFKVRLVLEELVLNVIDHAIDPATDRIDLRIDVDPDRVVLTVEDDSATFDPRSAPDFDKARPLEDRGPRGMGIHLVRSMAEDVTYERVDGRNRVRAAIRRA